MIWTNDTFDVLLDSWQAESFRPKPKLNLVEWADTYRQLSTETSNVGGRWRTSRFEVARGPMMATTERGVDTITCMVATQTLKTELLLNVIGYHAHLDPCPMMIVQPKQDSARIFSKERLAPMVRTTPALKALADDRVRGGIDTMYYKEFPGGFLAMAYAGSPTELAMRPIRITLLDEIDKYEATMKEGDPVMLAEERTATFRSNRLRVRCCSPTWEETSRIYQSYQTSDMRRPYVSCPHCDHWQTLDFFRNVHWSKNEEGEHFPMTAALYCEACGVDAATLKPIAGKEWTEAQRLRLVTTEFAIRWMQTKPFTCCGVAQEPAKTRNWEWDEALQVGYAYCSECGERPLSNAHAGFQASKLYSPAITMPELASKWVDAKDNPETKQVFYNSLDTATPILTSKGWSTMGALQLGDVVFGPDGKPTSVTGASDVFENRPCYEISFADGHKIVADEDHLWEVRDNAGKSKSVTLHKTRVTKTGEIARTFKAAQGRNRYHVRVTDPLHYKKNRLPIDPYLFGLWLGDGDSHSFSVASGRNDWKELVKLTRCKHVIGPDKNGVRRLNFPGLGYRKVLTNFGLRGQLGFKKIPRRYLEASKEQRRALLAGMMDSDGSISKRGVRFSNCSVDLVRDFCELATSLGFKPTVSASPQGGDGSTFNGYLRKATILYHVCFVAYSDQYVFRLNRKKSRLRSRKKGLPSRTGSRAIVNVRRVKSRPVRCISVDNEMHLYLCGRGLIPTHNTQLGLPFQLEAMRKIESHSLTSRKETFAARVPEGGLVLTAGVDVQYAEDRGRLEIEVVAWGNGYENWSVDYKILEGDPTSPLLWKQLDDYFLTTFVDAKGRARRVEAACIDTGGSSTEAVYKYCAKRMAANIWGIKGRSEKGGVWDTVWPAPSGYNPKKSKQVSYRPISIGVNAAKEAIREFLLVGKPGPGYCHFPVDRPENYFHQLTSEKLVLEYKGGRAVKKWQLAKGTANEALDVRVYAYAALRGLEMNRKFTFAKRVESLAAYDQTSVVPVTVATPVDAGSQGRSPRVHPSKFMR